MWKDSRFRKWCQRKLNNINLQQGEKFRNFFDKMKEGVASMQLEETIIEGYLRNLENAVEMKNIGWVKSEITITAAKSLQSCPTLRDPIDCLPPSSPVPGILQARTLEWVAISFSNAWKWKVKGKLLSRVWLLATPWTAAMGFSRQEYQSGVPLPSHNRGIKIVDAYYEGSKIKISSRKLP